MTSITIYGEAGRNAPIDATDDPERITAILAAAGVGFRRIAAPHSLPATADAESVLGLYAETVEKLKRSGGYTVGDVVRLLPTTPNPEGLRAKFLAEHTHDDDEVRFFVEGGGTFFLRAGDKVVELRGERGDLIQVPAGARHWFDIGEPPFFTCVRLFTREDGWVGALTGDPIPERFLRHAA